MESLYKRILIKVSGESLRGDSPSLMGEKEIDRLIRHVTEARDHGCQVALVVGGGNIWRGKESDLSFLSRSDADALGMCATLMNAIVLKAALIQGGIGCVVFSGLSAPSLFEEYRRDRALEFLSQGSVVLFAGGTGSPFFTTDTAASLRALEMGCDLLLKLTKVDGVYDRDPIRHKDAHRFETVTFHEALTHGYGVMDATAIALAQEGNLPVCVGSFFEEGLLSQLLRGKGKVTFMRKGRES